MWYCLALISEVVWVGRPNASITKTEACCNSFCQAWKELLSTEFGYLTSPFKSPAWYERQWKCVFSRPRNAKCVSYALPTAESYSLSIFSCHWEVLFLIAYKTRVFKILCKRLRSTYITFHSWEARYGLH